MSGGDVLQMYDDNVPVAPIEQDQRDAAGAYVASRAKVLGWTREEQVTVLLALFGEAKPVRRRHQAGPRETT